MERQFPTQPGMTYEELKSHYDETGEVPDLYNPLMQMCLYEVWNLSGTGLPPDVRSYESVLATFVRMSGQSATGNGPLTLYQAFQETPPSVGEQENYVPGESQFQQRIQGQR